MGLLIDKLVVYFVFMIGISFVLQPSQWCKLVHDAIDAPYKLFPIVLFMLFFGLFILLGHNIWEASWRVIVTITGVVLVLKACVYLLFPQLVLNLGYWTDKNIERNIRISGLLILLVIAYPFSQLISLLTR